MTVVFELASVFELHSCLSSSQPLQETNRHAGDRLTGYECSSQPSGQPGRQLRRKYVPSAYVSRFKLWSVRARACVHVRGGDNQGTTFQMSCLKSWNALHIGSWWLFRLTIVVARILHPIWHKVLRARYLLLRCSFVCSFSDLLFPLFSSRERKREWDVRTYVRMHS